MKKLLLAITLTTTASVVPNDYFTQLYATVAQKAATGYTAAKSGLISRGTVVASSCKDLASQASSKAQEVIASPSVQNAIAKTVAVKNTVAAHPATQAAFNKAVEGKDFVVAQTHKALAHPTTQAALHKAIQGKDFVVAQTNKALAHPQVQAAMTKIAEVSAPAIEKVKAVYNTLDTEDKIILGAVAGTIVFAVIAKKMSKKAEPKIQE